MLFEQNTLQQQNTAYAAIKTQLSLLQNRIADLKDPGLFDSRQTLSSDAAIATSTAGAGTALGSYGFSFTQLATASKLTGAANAGAGLSPTNDVSALVLSSAGFTTPVSAGNFTVDGKSVTIATTDTLQQVFDKINTATAGAVTATYDAAADKIAFSSASEIVLGSVTDSSNFLIAARLNNNGSGVVTSTASLGSIRSDAALISANFATGISDGGSGAGEFKINGVSIAFNAATESASAILKRINDSAAGVTASYDSVNDRFILANKSTGNIGIALEDVTGNFLAATQVATGTLARGQDLIYTVNGGGQLISHSNTITQDSHGIAGLTVNALKGGESTTATSQTSNEIGSPTYVSLMGGGGDTTRLSTAAPHGLETGYAVKFESSGTLPSQLVSGQTYYVRQVSTTDLRIFSTPADAAADINAIDFGTNPSFTGDVYLTRLDPTIPSTATTALGPPTSVSITVSSDTSKIKTAINAFLAEYNKAQSIIDSQTASTTDASGKVAAGILANDADAADIATRLRRLVTDQVSGLGAALNQLEDLGIISNGNDNSLKLDDEDKLDAALANSLTTVKTLFADSTNGLAVKFNDFLEKTAGEEGSLVGKQDKLTRDAKDIDTQIADMERIVLANRQRLLDSFIAMETAQAQINQQLQFLQQRFGTASSSGK